ncbi:MAG: type II toxin-antitoxin system Phd/YefM family antitoxin [Planctomycetota bacterium]|nr:type II toxin-antitoxin system Phd/YefM family antitoxin [Planctomycetota bacterium]
MLNVAKDIHSLTDFKRSTTSFLDKLRETRRALLLTVNGKAEVAVMGADTFQFVLEALDQLDTLQGIRRGLDQARRGEGVSLDEFDQAMRGKHGISSSDHPGGGGGD